MFAPIAIARITRLFLVALGSSIAIARAADSDPVSERTRARNVFETPAKLQIALGGPLKRQVRGVIERWLRVAPERNPAMLGMFEDRDRKPYRNLLPWSGEFAGKYLTACTEVLRLSPDPELCRKTEAFVHRFVELQDADGYLGPYPQEFRLTGKAPGLDTTWDAWGHYHAMLGLLAWHDFTGDAPALACATKVGHLLSAKFLGPDRHVAAMGSPDQNQAVIHSLALLYRRTGERPFADLALELVKEFELRGAGDYLRSALAGTEFYATPKPRWESLHSILGLAELHRITADTRYRRAFEQIWWSIVKLDRHNNGGFSSAEQAVGNPYDPRPIETCCTIAWMAMSIEMLKLTGNPVVADELELSTLNSVVGLHSEDGSWCTYNTPMDGRRVPSTTDIAFQIRPGSEQLNCCSVNAARGFGMLSAWAVLQETDGATPTVALNWFGPSTIALGVDGVSVTLTQKTSYPANGAVEIAVSPERPSRFALKLRIPHWSRRTIARVNGQPVPAKAGTYCSIEREWNAGDTISLDLDLSLRGWIGERECAGKVSLYRGPLLLVAETPGGKNVERPGTWKHFGELHASRDHGAAFEHDFLGTGVKWFGRYFDDAGVARVSIDGKEVARVDQYGPKRDQPFAWEHQGLAEGKHTIRIEVSGEKHPAAKDTWSNVVGFGPPGTDAPRQVPETDTLDLQHVTARLQEPPPQGAFVGVEVSDRKQQLSLRDFGTAGRDGATYRSWLKASGAAPAEFSTDNPSRALHLEEGPGAPK